MLRVPAGPLRRRVRPAGGEPRRPGPRQAIYIYIYIYIYICIYIHICMYIYIYIERERDIDIDICLIYNIAYSVQLL